jgi:hypothetical protein
MSKETSRMEPASDCFDGKLNPGNVINKEVLSS